MTTAQQARILSQYIGNEMIYLRNFERNDALELQKCGYSDLSATSVETLIDNWNKKQFNGKYFEMFAIIADEKVVGTVSLYQHSSEVVSIGPEIFCEYRRKGFAKEAMICACQIAKEKGFITVSQQVRIDNVASIALHSSLGFETNGVVFANSRGNQVLIYSKSLT